ncbi:MAG TPA: Holliday junction branch migration protein RuvA [Candidatus Nanoarchaeia archaeon]|nr:Holliday junction branch migration protein RuvA [Candidatus Nanoarchaeia archaeon]
MISYLNGKIVEKGLKYCILDINGLGYKVYTTDEVLRTLRDGGPATFWTHLAVREDALDIYGFVEKDSLDLFTLLINVSGIGPKTAMGIVNVSNPLTLRRAVSSGDLAYLTKVSGIGRKLAEKIILELREKLADYGEEHEDLKGETDALEALKSLGYSERESRDALKKISGENISAGDKVKKALKILGTAK